MLATLLDAGFAEREPGGQRWQLGLRLVHLGNAALARLDLRDLAAAPARAARARDRRDRHALAAGPGRGRHRRLRSQSSQRLQPRRDRSRVRGPRDGRRQGGARLHAGALAALAEPLERYTPRTLTTLAELELAVAGVRTAGVAEGAGEREPGLNAIAAPVLADDGRLVAVLGLQGPERFDAAARRAAALPLARAAALLAATAGLRR